MPYKDPDRKRKWEQAHQQERTERRRSQRRASRLPPQPTRPETSPADSKEGGRSGWGMLLLLGAALVGLYLGLPEIPGQKA